MAIILLIIILYPSIVKANSGASPIPHGLTGYDDCLACHGEQGMKPLPAGHTSFTQDSCLGCHSVPSEPSPPTGEPTPVQTEPPAIPLIPAPAPVEPLPHGNTSPDSLCLNCHAQPGMKITLANNEELSLYVDFQTFAASIHGDKLSCTDCHSSINSYPHPKKEIASRRQYTIEQYTLCQQCHFDNYTKNLDSIHYDLLSKGDMAAPVCSDCHGSHEITTPFTPRANLSETCSPCHQDIYQEYASSIHGKALIETNNEDVPSCTDCHLAHEIVDPRTAAFRLKSVELCSRCHGDKELMKKYGLSADVVNTYLNDFHGRTVALVGKQNREIWVKEAVCSDCHGIHNIKKVDSPDSPVIKANLAKTCAKCHPGTTLNFPEAWLSHYKPSINRAPLVFLAKWFYWIMIPFVLMGLCIHIVLDLRQAAKEKRKK